MAKEKDIIPLIIGNKGKTKAGNPAPDWRDGLPKQKQITPPPPPPDNPKK